MSGMRIYFKVFLTLGFVFLFFTLLSFLGTSKSYALIDISGDCYAFDETTGCGDTGTITVAFGNSIQAQVQTTVATNWTVTGLTDPATDTVVTIYIDGANDTDEAVAVTKYDGTGNITGVKLYKEHLTIGSDDNKTLSNTDLGTMDNSVSGDEDIFFDVNAGVLTVDATSQSTTEKLTILTSNTHQPGGNLTTHDIEIKGTFVPEANTLTVQGSYKNSGTLTSGTSTVSMTGTTTETLAGTMSGSTGKFYNLTFNGSGGAWSFTSNPSVDVANNFTITLGTVTSTSGNLTVTGNYKVTGTFTHNSGTVTFNATDSGNTYEGTTPNPSSSLSFYNLTFNGSGGAWAPVSNPPTAYLTITVNNDFTITNGTLTASYGLILYGNFTNNGTFTHNNGKVTLAGTSKTLSGNLSGTSAFSALWGNSGSSYSVTGGVDIEMSEYYLNNATFTSTSGNFISRGDCITQNGHVFNHNNGTVKLYGASNYFYNNPMTFYNLNIYGNAFLFGATNTMTIDNDLTIASGSLNVNTYDLLIKGNYSNSGTFTNNSKTVTFAATDAGNTIAGNLSGTSKFYNLVFNGAGGAWSFTSNPNVEVANDFSILKGVLTSTSATLTITGNSNFRNNAVGTNFISNSGTVKFNATDSGNTIWGLWTYSLYNAVFDGIGGTWSLSSDDTLVTISNDLTITNGTLTPDTYTALKITGNYSNSGTFNANNGTVTMNATDSGNTLGGNMTGTSKFYNLTFNGVAGAWSFTSNPAVEVANDLTITNGTVTSTSGNLTVTGNYSNAGTFTHNNGTVIFNATDVGNTLAGTLSGSSSFYNLTFSGAAGAWSFTSNPAVTVTNTLSISNGTVTATSGNTTIGGNFTKTGGTFTHNSGTVTFNDNTKVSTITYNANTTFSAFTVSTGSKQLKFDNVYKTTIAGTLTINGGACGTRIELHSDSDTNQFDIDATSTVSIDFADVRDSNAITALIATNSADTSNNTNWTITSGSCGMVISGICQALDETTGCGDTGTVQVAFGNSLQAQTQPTVGATWAITGLTAPAANTIVTIYIDGAIDTDEAVAVTKYDGTGDITGVKLYKEHLTIGSTDNLTLSNTELSTFDNSVSGDEDIFFDVNAGALTVDATAQSTVEKLSIISGNTLQPGGTITTHDLDNKGIFVPEANTITIQGSYSNSGTLTSGTSTFSMTSTTTDTLSGTLSGATGKFYNLTFNGSGGSWSFTSNPAVEVANNFTITLGTVTSTSGVLTITNNYSNSGTFTHNSGTVTMNATDVGNTLAGTLSGATGKFYNLTFNGSGGAWSFTSNPAVEIVNNFTITAGSVTSTSGNLTITNNYSNSGTFTHNSGTVIMNATDAGNTLAGTLSGATGKFYNLTFNGSGGAWSFASNPDVEAANNFTITLGTVTSTSGNLTVTNNYSNSGTFTHNSGTLTMNATDAGNTLAGTLSSTSSLYNLTFNGSGGAWSFTSNPTVKVDNNYTITAGTVTNVSTLTILGNFSNSGTLTNTGTVYMQGVGGKTLSGNMSGTSAFMSLWFNTGGTFSFIGGTDVEFSGDYYITGGSTVTSTSGNLIAKGDFIISNGLFQHNNGTVSFNKAGSQSFMIFSGGATSFYNITSTSSVNTSGSTFFTIDNNFTISSGVFYTGNDLLIKGNYSNSGTFTNNSKTVTFAATDAGNTLAGNLSGTSKFYNLVFNGVAGAWSFTSNPAVEVANDLTITNGTVTSTSGNLTVTGNYSNAGTFTHNNGTVIFNATDAGNTLAGTLSGSSSFYNLTFSGAAGAWSFTSNPAVTITNALSISNGTLTATSGNTTIGGNFTKTGGTFTHNSGTVIFNDNTKTSTLTYNADIIFNSFTVNTVSKTMRFDNVDKTTVSGTFTVTGSACGTPVNLYSDSDTNQFDIDLTGSKTIDYAVIKDSNAITAATANSSISGGNNTNWTINNGLCNVSPDSPTSLAQKTTGDVVITTGGWNNTTSIKFTATASDTNNPDTLSLCVEYQPLGTGFTNTEIGCGTGAVYSGTPVSVTVTLNSIPDAFEYHWQARIKDNANAYSAWVSYGGNAESARDYGLDTTAPTLSSINDGTSCGSDVTFNNGSLSSIAACWTQATATISGLAKYQYSVGTTSGATDVLTWTDLVDGSANVSITINSLTLQTSQQYFINVRAVDNATNTSSVISTNGQLVAPTISFSLSSSAVTFANLNSGNSYTDTKTSTLTTSTNAYNGYVVRAYKTQVLTNQSNPSQTISDFSAGSYAAPSAWSGYGYGYTSSDTLIQGVAKFPGSGSCLGTGTSPCYAPFSSTAPGDIVADHTASVSGNPISSEQFTVTYKVSVPATQAGGKYVTTIIYTIVPQY